MKSLMPLSLLALAMLLAACGSKKPKESDASKKTDAASSEDAKDGKTDEAVETAKKQIRNWLESDLVKKMSAAGKDLGKDIGLKLAANQDVMDKAKALITDIFKDKEVKPRLKKIEEKATAGFSKKLTLGWKALKAGGLDEFKKKVNADAQRVASEVLSVYVKEHVLKDERTAELLKGFAPVLKLHGQIAAVAVQDNLSPRVTKQVVGIALRIVAAGDNKEMSDRVDAWINECESDVDPRIQSFVDEVSALSSVGNASAALAVEVLGHPRTRRELVQLMVTLIENKTVNAALVKVYEAAAFEKGDPAIQKALEDVLALEAVDRELFATLTSLASAEGAGAIIGKHLNAVSEDPKLAEIVENFIVSVLETCGDPTQK